MSEDGGGAWWPPTVDGSQALRVLLVVDAGGVRFGAGRSVVELACRLAALPHVRVIFGAPQPEALRAHLEPAGVAVVRFPAPIWVLYDDVGTASERWARLRRTAVIARSLRRAVALLTQLDPDVVVTNNSIIASSPVAATALGVPHVWMVRELVQDRAGVRPVVPVRVWRYLLGRLSRRVVANSRATATALSPPVRAEQITVVEPACELPSAARPVGRPPEERPLRLLALGQLSEHKGAGTLLRGLRIATDAGASLEMRIVGEEMISGSEARADLDHLRRHRVVELVGPVNDPLEEIDRADVVAICSGIEGFGRVTVEALRRGRAVVAAAGGATPSIIDDGITGLLFSPDDSGAFAAALARLDDDRALVAQLGAAALTDAATRFLPEQQAAAFAAALEEVAGDRRRSHRFRLARAFVRRKRVED